MQRFHGPHQSRIPAQPARQEGQAPARTDPDQPVRTQRDGGIAEPVFRARTAVMQFVRMQHHDTARLRVARLAAIIEALHAVQGQRQRVGVMPVRRKGRVDQIGAKTLERRVDLYRGGRRGHVSSIRCVRVG